MKYRKLRIAWSVGWGILCLLLIVLWVRSYWKYDCVAQFKANQVRTSLDSGSAVIGYAEIDYSKISPVPMVGYDWRWEGNQPITEADAARIGPSFQWDRGRVGLAVSFPHWFPVLITAAMATLPWIRWSNRFSLRTLLIGMTVVAVALGVAIVALRGS